MKNQIKNELNILKNIIIETVPVKQIFLFGSYAYGTPHADSDLDLYIVLQDSANIREIDAMKLIRKAIRDKKTLPVDVVVSKEHIFNERKNTPTLERHILQEGMMIYG